jgi:predicted kinase|tara:strand:+ start:388 stop:1329 length:942 start_codon:yes stop_codon:yes gene_type:complete
MIKLANLIFEASQRPKAVVMAGGAGAGKSYLIDKLGLISLPMFNPDKYVEDPQHPYHNNLSAASGQVDKDVQAAAETGKSLVWDTTASNPAKIQNLIDKGYDVYMVMVYTHPMVAFINNFSRERRVPKTAVFSTWRNVYQLIGRYTDLLGDNFSLFVNLRQDKFGKEIEEFNKAARYGASGVADYLESYIEKTGGKEAYGSTFRKAYDLPSEDAKTAFEEENRNIEFDRENESMHKELKKYWFKFYEKNGTGPGDDKMKKKVDTIERGYIRNKEREKEVLVNIADMLTNSEFQQQLKHSSEREIEVKVQKFLK